MNKKKRPVSPKLSIILIVTLAILSLPAYANEQKKCLLLMSYHQGYTWNDEIEAGVVDKLKGVCRLKTVFMDTKRNSSSQFGQAAARRAMNIINQFQPDVLIASDDNASRYVIQPYFRNKSLPIVFCGINWTAEEYGYPYKNATGMVEVAPIVPLLKNIQRSLGQVKKGTYLSSKAITEYKDFIRYEKVYKNYGVTLTPVFVSSMKDWKEAYLKAQKNDFIVINNHAGINDWNSEDIVNFVTQESQTLTVTNYQWMMPFAMLGMTKKASEHGQWAGEVAAAILNGLPVERIPITVNKSWGLFINQNLLNKANIRLSNRILHHAHKTW